MTDGWTYTRYDRTGIAKFLPGRKSRRAVLRDWGGVDWNAPEAGARGDGATAIALGAPARLWIYAFLERFRPTEWKRKVLLGVDPAWL